VYGRPALAVPVTQVHADVVANWVSDAEADKRISDEDWRVRILIDAPDINLRSTLYALLSESNQTPHPLATVIEKTLAPLLSPHFRASKMGGARGVEIKITSTIPVASGLGSGAAVSVAVIRALSALFESPLTDEQVNALAYEVEKIHHGTPSGIDNTVITYSRPVYFIKGQPIETFKVGAPFTIVIGDTGVSAPTKESVGDVRKLWEADKVRWERVFDEVGEVVKQARNAIENGNKKEDLGQLMNRNHALLQAMTVSSPELDRLVQAGRDAGALGAKLSGGGRGGNMLALVESAQAAYVAQALMRAGAKNAIITEIA
jgi:mevalonate kinase